MPKGYQSLVCESNLLPVPNSKSVHFDDLPETVFEILKVVFIDDFRKHTQINSISF